MEETKRERFVRVAESRTNAALESIAKITKLAGKSYYEYSSEDIDKICNALDQATKKLHDAFEEDRSRFTLNAP